MEEKIWTGNSDVFNQIMAVTEMTTISVPLIVSHFWP